LAVLDSTVYVGGTFKNIGGQPRNNLAAVDAKTGLATDWNPCSGGNEKEGGVSVLAVSGTTVYVAGRFTSLGGKPRNCVAAIDAKTGQLTAWNPQVCGARFTGVDALAVSGSTVYIGGLFASVGGLERYSVAAIDAVTGEPTSWNPKVGDYWRVYSLAVSGSTFTSADSSHPSADRYEIVLPLLRFDGASQ